jgi:hypothetical protein
MLICRVKGHKSRSGLAEIARVAENSIPIVKNCRLMLYIGATHLQWADTIILLGETIHSLFDRSWTFESCSLDVLTTSLVARILL